MNELLQVRRPRFQFGDSVPRYWHEGSPALTRLCDAFTLVFPEAERYLIRIVLRCERQLQAQGKHVEALRAFVGQEAQHAAQHQAYLVNLRAQGVDVDLAVRVGAAVFRFFERHLSLGANLSLVVAGEHLATSWGVATLSRWFFRWGGTDPRLRALFEYHALEEIEHRAVAFDIQRAMGSGTLRRICGMIGAAAVIGGSLTAWTALMLLRDGELFRWRTLRDLGRLLFGRYRALPDLVAAGLEWVRPSFDPGMSSANPTTWSAP